MVRNFLLYIIIFTLILVTGCRSTDDVDNSIKKQSVDTLNVDNPIKKQSVDKVDVENEHTQIIEPNNKLGIALINKVDPDEHDNIFISPLSAIMALSMVLNGAEGKTKDEIIEAIALHDISVDDINRANASLMESLKKDSETIELSIANSIWLNEEFHFTDGFYRKTVDYFKAETTEIDVNNDKSVDKINNWVSESTNHKIDKITEAPLHPDMVAMLINALYFKGEWQNEFDKELTEEQSFYSSASAAKSVPMMTQEEDFEYMESDSFQAVKLPYGNGEMSMNVFLPSESSNMERFIAELTMDNWNAWNEQFQEMKGIVKLPKFQIEYEIILNDALKQMGMERAFDPEHANFSSMIKENVPLWIHEVKQKTFIDVNEEGTEAAAVTSIEMRTESARVEDSFYMEVNRPFFLTIIDEETDAILFMGVINSPEQAE